MGDASLIRTALLVALITAFGFAAAGRAPAAESGAAFDTISFPCALTTGLSVSADCFQPFCRASTCRR
jgi:hypothetical protein